MSIRLCSPALGFPFYKLAFEKLEDGRGCVNALSEYEYEVNERGALLEQAREYLRDKCIHNDKPVGTSIDQPSSNQGKKA